MPMIKPSVASRMYAHPLQTVQARSAQLKGKEDK